MANNQESMNERSYVQDAPPNDEIDILAYFQVLKKYAVLILAIAAVFVAVAAFVVTTLTPIYRSTATLLIETDKKNVVSIQEIVEGQPRNQEYLQTQVEILKSRELASAVIRGLNLGEIEEFQMNPPKTDGGLPQTDEAEYRQEMLVRAFSSRLSIEAVRKTQIIKVSFDSKDPWLAAEVANTVAEYYIQRNLDSKLQVTQDAASWLSTKLSGLREKLEESEQRLLKYQEENNLIDVDGVNSLKAKELGQSSTSLAIAKENLAKAKSIYVQVNRYKGDKLALADSVTVVRNDPVVRNWKLEQGKLQRELFELSQKYGNKHPKILAINSKIGVINGHLREQISQVIKAIQSDYRIAQDNVRALQSDITSGKGEIQQVNRKKFALVQLEREVEANRELYNTFFTRIRETDETAGLQVASASIADRAVPETTPVKPKKALIVALAGVVGMILGIVAAFILDMLNSKISSASEVEKQLQTPMLGVLPHLGRKFGAFSKSDHNSSYFAFQNDSNPKFTEAVRTIRTQVCLSGLDSDDKVILVTSSVPAEGKTTFSINLALSFAQLNERVLLIDTDMRRPSVANAFDLGNNALGLSDFLSGKAGWRQCVLRYKTRQIDVLPAGTFNENPLELLQSSRFKELVSKVRERYDHIVIDAPPAQAVSDPLVISAQADATIFVARAESTKLPTMKTALGRLKTVGANVIGVVLSQVAVKKGSAAEDYYGGYYDHYGYTKDEHERSGGSERAA